MSRFTEAQYTLTGELKRGRPVVCLTTPLVYQVGFKGSGWDVTAPAGFCCDLASIPAWILRTKFGKHLAVQIARASIPHDLMRNDRRWPKLLGDYVFFEAMGVDGVPLFLRTVAFVAVLFNFTRD